MSFGFDLTFEPWYLTFSIGTVELRRVGCKKSIILFATRHF